MSDLVIVVWSGYQAGGRGGTADVATYARSLRHPFVHIHTQLHTTKRYGSLQADPEMKYGIPGPELTLTKQTVYQGQMFTVEQYRWQLPNRDEIEHDIVERPESVLVLPVGQKNNVILIEEYDLGAGAWQLTLPGGRVIDSSPEGIWQQAQNELREETGFRASRFEKLLDCYSHPEYVAHKVHLLVAYDLEWDPLVMEDGEEIRVHTLR